MAARDRAAKDMESAVRILQEDTEMNKVADSEADAGNLVHKVSRQCQHL